MRGKSALIIVDIQNDFLPGGALGVHQGDEVIPVINRIMSLPFDLVIASRDFHPANHVSFASTWKKKPGEHISLPKGEQILWQDHCIQDSFGCQFPQSLDTTRIQHVVNKGTDPNVDSYSIFFDNFREKETEAKKLLQEHEISKVYIVGLATDYCVFYSALDAVELGFFVTVVLDGCRGVNLEPEDSEKKLNEMRRYDINLISEKELFHNFKFYNE